GGRASRFHQTRRRSGGRGLGRGRIRAPASRTKSARRSRVRQRGPLHRLRSSGRDRVVLGNRERGACVSPFANRPALTSLSLQRLRCSRSWSLAASCHCLTRRSRESKRSTAVEIYDYLVGGGPMKITFRHLVP